MKGQIVEVRGLSKSFKSGAETVEVLKNLELSLTLGKPLAIMGESGAGKSTLLKILGALDCDFSGSASVCGVSLKSLSGDSAADFRALQVGFMFQAHYFLPQFTILENVLLPSVKFGAKTERARQLLDRVGVLKLKDRFPGEVSGGELQRAALARALINSPKLLIADEPTGALDEANADNLCGLILELSRSQMGLILATHSQRLAEQVGNIKMLAGGSLH